MEVNGVEMTGKSQSEAVAVLRNAQPGSKVRIVVSRQEDVLDTSLPRIIVSFNFIFIKIGVLSSVPDRQNNFVEYLEETCKSHDNHF